MKALVAQARPFLLLFGLATFLEIIICPQQVAHLLSHPPLRRSRSSVSPQTRTTRWAASRWLHVGRGWDQMTTATRKQHRYPQLQRQQLGDRKCHAVDAEAGRSDLDEVVVQIVTSEGCKFCKRTKEAMSQRGIPFEELSVSNDPSLLASLSSISGLKTVPQVFVGGAFVGDGEATISLLVKSDNDDQSEGGGRKSFFSAADKSKILPAQTIEKLRVGDAKEKIVALAYRDVSKQILISWDKLKTVFITPTDAHPELSRNEVLEALIHQHKHLPEKDDHVDIEGMLEELIHSNLMAETKGGKLIFTTNPPPPKRGEAINSCFEWKGHVLPPSQISELLQRGMSQLLDSHGREGGKTIDYKALAKDPAFGDIVRLSHQLAKSDPAVLSRDERMAFYINIYNVLIVHAMTARGPPPNLAARMLFYGEAKYVIAGSEYSCNDIENGVLRGNRPSPASVQLPFTKPTGPFKGGDPRLSQVISPPDPRIHFALNCGAKSCPAIRVYTGNALEMGLQAATESFCADESNVNFDRNSNTLTLSKIFQWYRPDFGSDLQLQELLVNGVTGKRGISLKNFFEEAPKPKLVFADYNWDLNEA